MVKLTKWAVEALKPGAKPYVTFDGEVNGFGLRVMPSGVRTFILEYRPHGGGRAMAKKRLTIGRHGAMTAEQARKAALDALARIRLGDDPQAEKTRQRASLTVGGLVDAFIAEHVAKKCKPRTAEAHMIALRRLREALGGVKAEALTRAQIATLHSKFKDSPFAANRFLAVISKCFVWGAGRGLLPDGHVNPARGIERYKEHSRERFLTSEELSRLGDALREGETVGLPYEIDETKPRAKHAPKADKRRTKLDPFAAAAIRLLILTGARLREILDAQWQHADFERGVIFLPDSKTGKKPIYLSSASLAILSALPRLEGNPHIVAGMKDGAPRADLKKPWAAVTKAAGLEGLRIHDLRHSFASVGAVRDALTEPDIPFDDAPPAQPNGNGHAYFTEEELPGHSQGPVKFPFIAFKDVTFDLDEECRVEGIFPLVGLACIGHKMKPRCGHDALSRENATQISMLFQLAIAARCKWSNLQRKCNTHLAALHTPKKRGPCNAVCTA